MRMGIPRLITTKGKNLATVPLGTTAYLRVFNNCDQIPLNFYPLLPHFQLLIVGSGKVTTSSVKLSDFGLQKLQS